MHDDRHADLIGAYRAGERDDIDDLIAIAERETATMAVVGLCAAALSGAIVGAILTLAVVL